MKKNNTNRSVRNLISGFALKIFQIIVLFVIRTLIIKELGFDYAGLNSLFNSILTVLNLAESGISTAMLVSMYEPIVKKDSIKLCALLNLYKIYYRVIGMVILILGLVITPLIPNLIYGSIPSDINLYIIYFLNLGVTVLSYWLFSYKISVLQAYQRYDVLNIIYFCSNSLQYLLQIFLLIFTKNYYLYLITVLVFQIITNLTIGIVSNILFPKAKPDGNLSVKDKKQINSLIKDLFNNKVGMIVTLSVDSIIISIFLGLVPLGIYQNYNYIITALIGFFTIFLQSIRSAVGTNLITKTIEENYLDYKFIFFIGSAIIAFFSTCYLSLVQTFMRIWVGSENCLDNSTCVLFTLYMIVYLIANLIMFYRDCAGLWHSDRFRPLITALLNLVLNIVFVNFMGINGILLVTILSYLIVYIPWGFSKIFTELFDKSKIKETIFMIFINLVMIVISTTISYLLCNLISFTNLYLELFLKGLVSFLISIFLIVIFNLKNNNLKKIFSKLKNSLFYKGVQKNEKK